MKRRIKLTESRLHNIILESVKRILNESWESSAYETVDVVDALDCNGRLFKYVEEGGEDGELILDLLSEYGEVEVEINYTDYPAEDDTGYYGGYGINGISLEDEFIQTLNTWEQQGKIPQGFANEIIDAVEERAQKQFDDDWHNGEFYDDGFYD
jgi:hypothetical protein